MTVNDPWKGMGARVLRGVADLFAQPGTWTQDAWARDVSGERLVRAHDPDAVCWCFRGAIKKVAGPGCMAAEDEAISAVRDVLRAHTNESIAAWNDDSKRTVDDVIRVATKAAVMLEARQ